MAVDRERVSAGFFTDAFKNTLRDYYAYGFREARDYTDSEGTITNNWNRLNSILHDGNFWTWADSPRGRLFVTADSRVAPMNLFQLVYLYCGFKADYPIRYFQTVFALSPHFGYADIEAELEQFDEHPDYDGFEKRFREADHTYLTSAELSVLTGISPEQAFSGNYHTLNRFLKPLADLGILQDIGFSNKNRWKLNNGTIGELLAAVPKDPAQDLLLETRFLDALDFFSQYLPLGEIGLFLMQRLRDNPHAGGDDIRFRHEYMVNALNDYHLIDILDAIERKKWLVVRYSHALKKVSGEIVCLPLEIRQSDANGRSYLMFYDPQNRTLGTLRLEMIDGLQIFKKLSDPDGHTVPVTEAAYISSDLVHCRETLRLLWGVSSWSAGSKKGSVEESPVPHRVRVEWDLKRANPKRLLYRAKRESRNGTVRHDPENGRLIWEGDVMDPGEMRPWIRSFYGTVRHVEGLDDYLDPLREIDGMNGAAGHSELPPEGYGKQSLPAYGRLLEDGTLAVGYAGTGFRIHGTPCTAHEMLFNEAFGIYYHVFASWLTDAAKCTEEDQRKIPLTRHELLARGRRILSVNDELRGMYTAETATAFMEEMIDSGRFFDKGFRRRNDFAAVTAPGYGGFIPENELPAGMSERERGRYEACYRPRYTAREKDLRFGRDVTSLTLPERRWLLSMLQESRVQLFLTQEERAAMQKWLIGAEGVACMPYDLSVIRHFDRFHIIRDDSHKEKAQITFRRFLRAMHEERLIHVVYRTSRGRIMEVDCQPIDIEFSKRDNTFHMIAILAGEERVDSFSLSRIIETALVKGIDTHFDQAGQKELVDELLEARDGGECTATVIFPADPGIADRILTEFSPWKKTCIRQKKADGDSAAETLSLRIRYLSSDEEEIIARLLGYGGHIRVLEKQLRREIARRAMHQQALFSGIGIEEEREEELEGLQR